MKKPKTPRRASETHGRWEKASNVVEIDVKHSAVLNHVPTRSVVMRMI